MEDGRLDTTVVVLLIATVPLGKPNGNVAVGLVGSWVTFRVMEDKVAALVAAGGGTVASLFGFETSVVELTAKGLCFSSLVANCTVTGLGAPKVNVDEIVVGAVALVCGCLSLSVAALSLFGIPNVKTGVGFFAAVSESCFTPEFSPVVKPNPLLGFDVLSGF